MQRSRSGCATLASMSCRAAHVIERAISWLFQNRRLGKDYEHLPETEETSISRAMIRLMLCRPFTRELSDSF